MKRLSNWNKALRTIGALTLMFAVSVTALPQPQEHDMSKMPGMKMPKAKSAPRKKKPRAKARRAAKKKPGTKKPSASPTPSHEMMPGMQMPSASPTPPHEMMPVMQLPSASPTPSHEMMPGMQMPSASPTPSHEMMPGMQMPSASPTPSHEMMPGMQMPEASPTPAVDPDPQIASRPVLRLEDLEAMALKNNPTLAQADAGIRAAEGRRIQAGLFPNPTVGYFVEEFVFRSPGESAEHGVFVEQTFPLGGKLGKSRRIFAREKEQAELIAEAQKMRVLNSVRLLYYEALGAQRLVDLRVYLAGLTREATEITRQLHNVGQADTPDQLEIEIETQRAEIDLLRAQNDREEVWRALGAMVNNPELKPSRLEGSLEVNQTALDEDQIMSSLLRESPEIRVAQAGAERARAVLARARAQKIPDLSVSGGLAYNFERFEPLVPTIGNQRKGMEGRLQVGVNVPIFNRNQGGIAAAEAELGIAERELQRLQLTLRTRVGSSLRAYRNALQMTEKYRTEVIPRARAGYEMYLSNFRQMAAAYPQVLIAQRTLFQVEVEYARALIQLRQTGVGLRGFLLTGGLDSVGRPGESTEGIKLRSPNEATGESDRP